MPVRINYENDSIELLVKIIIWAIGFLLVLPIPWVINSQIKYFSKGFTLREE